jgi:hypothetical protein
MMASVTMFVALVVGKYDVDGRSEHNFHNRRPNDGQPPRHRMPPGSAYNWLCVIHGAVDILSHAARHRANQATPHAVASYINPRKRRRTDTELDNEAAEAVHKYLEPLGVDGKSVQVIPEKPIVEMKDASEGGRARDAPLPPIRRVDKLEIVKDTGVSVSSETSYFCARISFQ